MRLMVRRLLYLYELGHHYRRLENDPTKVVAVLLVTDLEDDARGGGGGGENEEKKKQHLGEWCYWAWVLEAETAGWRREVRVVTETVSVVHMHRLPSQALH